MVWKRINHIVLTVLMRAQTFSNFLESFLKLYIYASFYEAFPSYSFEKQVWAEGRIASKWQFCYPWIKGNVTAKEFHTSGLQCTLSSCRSGILLQYVYGKIYVWKLNFHAKIGYPGCTVLGVWAPEKDCILQTLCKKFSESLCKRFIR